jgi:hypothetical protein
MLAVTQLSADDMKLSYATPEPEPILATPESVESSSVSPESGVLAAEVFVLDPSLCNENSPARKMKSVAASDEHEMLHIRVSG